MNKFSSSLLDLIYMYSDVIVLINSEKAEVKVVLNSNVFWI